MQRQRLHCQFRSASNLHGNSARQALVSFCQAAGQVFVRGQKRLTGHFMIIRLLLVNNYSVLFSSQLATFHELRTASQNRCKVVLDHHQIHNVGMQNLQSSPPKRYAPQNSRKVVDWTIGAAPSEGFAMQLGQTWLQDWMSCLATGCISCANREAI